MATTRATLTPAIVPDEAGDLIVTAIQEDALASQVATVYVTDRQSMTFPRIDTDLAASWRGEAAPVVLSDLGTSEVTIKPTSVTTGTRISLEALEDTDPAAATILGQSIGRSLAAKIDAAVLGSAADPAPAGLGRATGLTAVGTTMLEDDGLDGFHDALAAVRTAGATPTAIIVGVGTGLRLAKLRESGNADARRGLLTADATAPTPYAVGGVPFVISRHVPDTVAYAVARDRLALVIRRNATLELDRSIFALTREALCVGEARVGFAVLHPASVAKLTLTPAT